MTAKSRLFLLVIPALLLPLASCTKGNKNANADVSGKVTYKGAPVTGGNMLFHVESGGNTPVLLKPDGTFEGTSLPVGEVTVTIETAIMKTAGGGQQPKYGQGQGQHQAGSSPMPPGVSQGQGGTYVKIPEKYEKKETSPLKRTLKSGKQTWDMELTD